jgi:hypothetical protein
MRISVVYLKGILVGVVALAVTMIVSSVIAVAIVWRFPEVAVRIFPGQRHELGWGEFYAVNFPIWPTVIVGLLAFAVAFRWMLSRGSARM